MSNFLKRGKRQFENSKRKQVKIHTKEFYKILGRLDNIVKELPKDVQYTEENINEYVKPLLGRDLDSMEKFLTLGKLGQYESKDNS